MTDTRDPRFRELHRLFVRIMRVMPSSPKQAELVARFRQVKAELAAEGHDVSKQPAI